MKLSLIKTSILLPATLAVLSGCTYLGIGGDDGWLRDRQADYLSAPDIPPMQIPADLDSYTIDELYLIPPEPAGERDFYIQPPPPRPVDTRIREGVVVQQFGERAWIVVGATPGQIWPRLRDYWSTEGIALSRENPTQGLMETVWLEDTGISDLWHRYRVTIEPGLHAGNSEIYVRHLSDQGQSAPDMPQQWPEGSENSNMESAMLASISLYLAERTDLYRASSVSLLAGSIEADSKARLIPDSGGPTRLELRLDFERAWSQVGQALANANIEITGSDRDQGLYQVSYSGEESEEGPGFFSRLFRRGSADEDFTAFNVTLAETADGILVQAATQTGESAPYLQDMLVRTINDNLI